MIQIVQMNKINDPIRFIYRWNIQFINDSYKKWTKIQHCIKLNQVKRYKNESILEF